MPNHKFPYTSYKNNKNLRKSYKKLEKVKNKSNSYKFLNTQKLPYKAPSNDNPPPVPPQEFTAEMRRVKKVIDKKRAKRGFSFPSVSDIWLNQFNSNNFKRRF